MQKQNYNNLKKFVKKKLDNIDKFLGILWRKNVE